ncbi:hypothetical protein GCM10025871_06560 [Deinococcus metallilatus]|nr:hypothetical protein GCM10025871_06560 [Deinococcus metallilatus]
MTEWSGAFIMAKLCWRTTYGLWGSATTPPDEPLTRLATLLVPGCWALRSLRVIRAWTRWDFDIDIQQMTGAADFPKLLPTYPVSRCLQNALPLLCMSYCLSVR